MKAARIVVLTVAIGAGAVAAMLAGRSQKPPAVKPEAAVKVNTVDILVARSDIPMGTVISPSNLQWQAWPASTAAGNFIRRTDRPNAIENLTGQIARAPFVQGEPIREAKLVNAKGAGFMAAILPPGMRAVSIQISPETSAGGFILPNDRVDVILTRRDRDADRTTGGGGQASETILRNIRVLAIDQALEEKGGQKVAIGKTATLELTPDQAETLTLSQQLGSLSLALRSITDTTRDGEAPPEERGTRSTVNIVRFGVSTTTRR